MNKRVIVAILLVGVLVGSLACVSVKPTPTPMPSPTPEPTQVSEPEESLYTLDIYLSHIYFNEDSQIQVWLMIIGEEEDVQEFLNAEDKTVFIGTHYESFEGFFVEEAEIKTVFSEEGGATLLCLIEPPGIVNDPCQDVVITVAILGGDQIGYLGETETKIQCLD